MRSERPRATAEHPGSGLRPGRSHRRHDRRWHPAHPWAGGRPVALAPLVLGAWLVGGIYALLGAICIAELAASLPRAGGWYLYAERAFGPRAGFLVGWTDWLAHCIGLAWVATTVGEYGQVLLPDPWRLMPHPAQVLGLVAIGLFTLIQLRGLRTGSASQELLSLVKAVAFLALVAACFLLPSPAALAGASAPPRPGAPPRLATADHSCRAGAPGGDHHLRRLGQPGVLRRGVQ
jgi:amino acid transporter